MMTRYRETQLFEADLESSSLKEKSIRGGLFTMCCQAIDSTVRIASIAILARILTPEDFGLFGMVTALTAIAEQFKDFGLSTATIQRKDITPDQISRLFWINVVIGLGITIVISALSFFLAWFFHEERLVYITLVIATGFFWSALSTQHQALLQRQMRYATLGGIQLGSTVISVGIATLLAVEGYGYWSLVWREVLRNVFISVGTWMWCPWTPSMPRKHTDVSHLIKFGRDITAFNVIVFFASSVDQILIGKVYGATQLGFYRQAYQLVFWPVMQLIAPVSRVAAPTLSFLQDNAERYRKVYRKVLMTTNFILMPMLLFSAIYSREIVSLVLGAKWIEAAPIFRILALAVFIIPASSTTGLLLVTCGKTKRYLKLGFASGFVLVLSFSIGVVWGAVGVAYGYLAATYTLLAVGLCFSFEGTPVSVRTFYESIETPL